MTIEGLKYIISHSEGTEIEYKKSRTGLARSVYETICTFLAHPTNPVGRVYGC